MSNLQERLLSTIPSQIECLESHLRLFKQLLKNKEVKTEPLLSEALNIHFEICGIIDDLELLDGFNYQLPDYLSMPEFPF